MNIIFLVILLILSINILNKKALTLILSFIKNFMILITMYYLMALGFDILTLTIISIILLTIVILFDALGYSYKTVVSFLSVIIVLIILSILILFLIKFTNISGFGLENLESIYMYSENIKINMNLICFAFIITNLIGALIDTSLSISTSLNEIYTLNNKIKKDELYQSGINIGKDILGSTINTVLFAFVAEFLSFILYLIYSNYSIVEILNTKTFNLEIIKLIICILGCVIIIPITSFLFTKKITNK